MGFDTHLGGEKLEQEVRESILARTLGVFCGNGSVRNWRCFVWQLYAGHCGSGYCCGTGRVLCFLPCPPPKIASEFGVNLGATSTSRDNGKVGGEMTKRLVENGKSKKATNNK